VRGLFVPGQLVDEPDVLTVFDLDDKTEAETA
jgi:hypothetical protein